MTEEDYQMMKRLGFPVAETDSPIARLREQAEKLAEALTRIAEGDAESYLSCPGVPICSRTHDDNCAVGIAAAALRAYREADPPEGDDEYGMVKA